MTVEDKLKPCPFCGEAAEMVDDPRSENARFIRCICCGARTDTCYDYNETVHLWNRRDDNND